ACAIWGARAGNGVIVITTKSGKFNSPLRVSFNSFFSIGSKPNVFEQDQMSPADHVTVDSFLVYNHYFPKPANNLTHFALPPVADAYFAGNLTDDLLQQYRSLDVRNDMQRLFYRHSLRQHLGAQMSAGGKTYAYQILLGYDHASPELQQSDDN